MDETTARSIGRRAEDHEPKARYSREETQQLIQETVRETVRETFLILGLQVDDPIEVQRDFQHLREWRRSTEAIKAKGLLTIVGLAAAALAAAFWLGVKEALRLP